MLASMVCDMGVSNISFLCINNIPTLAPAAMPACEPTHMIALYFID